MRLLFIASFIILAACSHRVSAPTAALTVAASEARLAPSPSTDAGVAAAPLALRPDGGTWPESGALESEAADEDGEGPDDDPDEGADPIVEETESRDVAPGVSDQVRYTQDISDEALKEKWTQDVGSLGSISVGFADEGRMVNAQQMPEGEGWTVVSPSRSWATSETLGFVTAAISEVRRLHPNAPLLRVNQMSAKDGGYLPPHKSHQSGRDVDLAFYYQRPPAGRPRDRYKYMDPALNWSLVKALVTLGDVQMILTDRKVQRVLYDYAIVAGEDRDWLDKLFHTTRKGLIQHARRHRDHFHVRFYNPRAQELGRRVAPLLALRPEQNLAMHRVRSGNTLGAIARKYRSSVAAIQKANHMRGSFLRLNQLLKIPLRGLCTHCPVPPPIEIPGRLLPPTPEPVTSGVEETSRPHGVASPFRLLD